MKKIFCYLFFGLFVVVPCSAQTSNWASLFKDPPNKFRPMPFWHMNGKLSKPEIERQMNDMHVYSGFGGVTVLPVSAQQGFGSGKVYPGMEPAYLSDEYFDFYSYILQEAKKMGMNVVWY